MPNFSKRTKLQIPPAAIKLGIGSALLFIAMISGSGSDLSTSLYLSENWADTFGIFSAVDTQHYALVAIFAAGILAGALVSLRSVIKPKWLMLLSLLLVTGLGVTLVILKDYEPEIWFNLPLLAYYLIILLVFVAAFLLSRWLCLHKNARLTLAIAAVGCLLMLLDNLIVYGLKEIWLRERFYAMTDPTNQFTNWYEPAWLNQGSELAALNEGESEQFKSFPSGHALAAANLMWLVLFCNFIKQVRIRRIITMVVLVLICTWMVLVMLSRIALGFHFWSDVTFSVALTLFCFMIVTMIVANLQFFKPSPAISTS